MVGGYTVTNWMWGDKEGGRERAPDSRTQGEVGLSACIGGLLATWRRMGVLGVQCTGYRHAQKLRRGVCGYMGYMEIQGVWDMLYLDIVRWEGMRTGCRVIRRVA